ncbi:hypothetical protein GCM10011608_09310 [Micromonospora sonchi]|uniref:Uncharacterized protein n=1 Tax=Micromonospora sonchi TaxID=1763543 RepID=A0A917WTG7_9ACTN|nr:hypothetical protein [Micromonospora sonchi]GGM26622.1 hypothetical protein GCM10011608_09310 [Micromonospora sonchi]
MTDTAPRTGPTFHGVTEDGDRRFYIFGDHRLVSCTAVTGVIAKDALLRYAANQAVAAVFEELPAIVIASRIKPCGNTSHRCDHDNTIRCDACACRECKTCIANWLAERHMANTARRADEGTRVHDVIEWWALHGEIKPYDDDIAPYVKAFQAFVVEYGLTPDSFLLSEALVVNRGAGYAGTTDGVIRIYAAASQAAAKLVSRVTGVPWKKAAKLGLTVDLVIDFKTREGEKPRFYPEQALQLTGYRHAPIVRIKNSDEEFPMLPTDGGMLVQLRPDGVTVRLAVTTERTYRRGFLYALGLTKWLIEEGPAAVSAHTFVLPETIAARKRKAAKEAAAAVPAEPAPAAA